VGVAIYSDEFKDGAVKQVLEGGHPVQEVAKRLGVSTNRSTLGSASAGVPGLRRMRKMKERSGQRIFG
jgi:transposase-like protein